MVAVCKNPCLHPGGKQHKIVIFFHSIKKKKDFRILEAVEIPDLYHLDVKFELYIYTFIFTSTGLHCIFYSWGSTCT